MSKETANSLPDAAWRTRFRRDLLKWYTAHARDLPWRRTRDPYHIWISEIMLQQTTVAAVVPYFERFLEKFPNIASLAAAPEREVLKLWEGLGYYSRARNIHRAARAVSESGGRFPETVEELQRLPGIGRYTAGAIASFAFDTRAPVVEANTLRLYSRLLGYRDDPRAGEGQKLLWQFAETVLPKNQPGRMNQAMMELGSVLCTPREPQCGECPVQSSCRAFTEGAQDSIPRPKPRPTVTNVSEANIVVWKNNQVLIRQHARDERWAGLWDFPRYPVGLSASDQVTPKIVTAVLSALLQQTGVCAAVDSVLCELKHSVTRYRIRLLCFSANRTGGRLARGQKLRWVRPRDLIDIPLSVTARKITRLLIDE